RLAELRHTRHSGGRVVRARQRVARADRALHRQRRAGATRLRAAQALGTYRRRGRRALRLMQAKNTKHVAHIDVPGGGQVWVEGTTLFVGHMKNPNGTSIIEVRDPKRPELLATVPMPEGWHSHKVRVANGVMIVNHERFGQGNADF